MTVVGKPFQPCLMFAGKGKTYPSEATFKPCVLVRLLALPSNVKLDWKGLPTTYSLAFLQRFVNYGLSLVCSKLVVK